jgi:glycerophosphoryl diester phosphodiesterase
VSCDTADWALFQRKGLTKWLAPFAAVVVLVSGCSGNSKNDTPGPSASRTCTGPAQRPAAVPTGTTPVELWLASTPLFIAHRGGDADWTEGTAYAYRNAATWNPKLALEVPVWKTSDGVYVISEEAATGRVFGTNYDIRSTPWAALSMLRTVDGGYPMGRLVNDVLVPYGSSRIFFVDNKSNADLDPFFDLLDSYGGKDRFISKSYYNSRATAAEAHARGYLTWGYYYEKDMANFAATESRFDLLGLNYSASAKTFETMLATGKQIIAHVIATPAAELTACRLGVSGYMVSGITQVVKH